MKRIKNQEINRGSEKKEKLLKHLTLYSPKAERRHQLFSSKNRIDSAVQYYALKRK